MSKTTIKSGSLTATAGHARKNSGFFIKTTKPLNATDAQCRALSHMAVAAALLERPSLSDVLV